MVRPTNEDLFRVVTEWVRAYYPGRSARRLTISLDGEPEPVSLPVPPPPPTSDLTDSLEDAVVAALEAESPLNAKKLASRTGYRYNSHFRQQLAEMVRAGVIERTPDGYRVSGD